MKGSFFKWHGVYRGLPGEKIDLIIFAAAGYAFIALCLGAFATAGLVIALADQKAGFSIVVGLASGLAVTYILMRVTYHTTEYHMGKAKTKTGVVAGTPLGLIAATFFIAALFVAAFIALIFYIAIVAAWALAGFVVVGGFVAKLSDD